MCRHVTLGVEKNPDHQDFFSRKNVSVGEEVYALKFKLSSCRSINREFSQLHENTRSISNE
jgi:hypothetical protein